MSGWPSLWGFSFCSADGLEYSRSNQPWSAGDSRVGLAVEIETWMLRNTRSMVRLYGWLWPSLLDE